MPASMPDFRSLTRLHLGYVHLDSWKYVTIPLLTRR
ncbi:hypothetical protein KSS87_015642 [Heliosperma pusillum]|nr:hypothetical protein KSS87_015642 [Heliosperma pusillum]